MLYWTRWIGTRVPIHLFKLFTMEIFIMKKYNQPLEIYTLENVIGFFITLAFVLTIAYYFRSDYQNCKTEYQKVCENDGESNCEYDANQYCNTIYGVR